MTHTAISVLRGAVLLILTTCAASALPGSPSERAKVFATCSGRLSALATRQRALNSPEIQATEQVLANFDMMLDATLPAAVDYGMPPAQARHWHSGGWVEIAALLADAQYSLDAGMAERARIAIDQRIQSCHQLLLPKPPET